MTGDILAFQSDQSGDEQAQATILKIWDSGSIGRDKVSIGLLLEVRPFNQPAYQAQTTLAERRSRRPLFRTGQVVRVKIDRADPRKVRVITDRTAR